jgi:hypothetical protein
VSHPPECNCPECSPVDPFATKRLKKCVANFRNSLTEKELRLLRKRFAVPDRAPDKEREE